MRAATSNSPTAPARRRLRALLVEDNPADVELVRKELLKAGFALEADATDRLEDFTELLTRREYDVIVADYRLPGWTGMDALRILKEQGKEIPLILMTGCLGDETAAWCIKQGASDYVLKENLARLPHAILFALKEAALERERRQAQEELSRTTQIRLLANTIPGVVWSADASGRTVFLNDWWYEYTGLTPEESLGGDAFLKVMPPEDAERAQRAWQRAVSSRDLYENEYRFRRKKDGTYRWHLVRGVPLRDVRGIVVRWFGTCTDIEDLKQAQQALLRSEKLASAGRIAATVAHEINNPLNAVINALFLARAAPGTPPAAQHYLDVADLELRRVSQIAQQALGFYRDSSSPTTTPVADLLDSAVNLLDHKVRAKKAVIVKQYETALRVMAVPGELRQVFLNLISNSLDAVGEHGTIHLRISASNYLRAERCVRVTVADNGPGISPEAQQSVGEPFFTTKQDVGTGLGLWISKQIVAKHRGSFRIHSRTQGQSRGTTVSIVLPMEVASAATRSHAAGL